MTGTAGAGVGMRFADRLADAVDRVGSCACVGLDPVIDRLPRGLAPADARDRGACAGAIERFSLGVLEAVSGIAAVVKPQSACYEQYGWEGVRALERVCAAARALGMVVILDVKRGDIGVTAERYADAAFGAMGADAMTASAFMGLDTLEPLLGWAGRAGETRAGRGVFALVRTSNAGSDAVQSLRLETGETVAECVAREIAALGDQLVGERGWSSLGAVVAATKPADAERLRALMARQPLLVPGWGAQGGSPETVRGLLAPARGGGAFRGAVVSASRSVIYPEGSAGETWEGAVRAAALRFTDELRSID